VVKTGKGRPFAPPYSVLRAASSLPLKIGFDSEKELVCENAFECGDVVLLVKISMAFG